MLKRLFTALSNDTNYIIPYYKIHRYSFWVHFINICLSIDNANLLPSEYGFWKGVLKRDFNQKGRLKTQKLFVVNGLCIVFNVALRLSLYHKNLTCEMFCKHLTACKPISITIHMTCMTSKYCYYSHFIGN